MNPFPLSQPPLRAPLAFVQLLTLLTLPSVQARQWTLNGLAAPIEAELLGTANGYALIRGDDGQSLEVPLTDFSLTDQQYLTAREQAGPEPLSIRKIAPPTTKAKEYQVRSDENRLGQFLTIPAQSELHLTGVGDVLQGSSVNFTEPDGWLIFEAIRPSQVMSDFLNRFLVLGSEAVLGENIRIARYGEGSVVIPHGDDFAALTAFPDDNLGGESLACASYQAVGKKELSKLSGPVRSFVLKRGYTATLAQNGDGTGFSRNYVAQDHDLVITSLPKEFDSKVNFIRVFPWQWTTKKGIAGGIHQNLALGWFYDWNITKNSTPDLEYVGIKQKQYWPSLQQDWKKRGSNHLLGFNEPDKKDQANMSVEAAIKSWPALLKTGLRLGSPSTSDGGLNWLYQFMERADKEGLRVDFVAVHYYRSTPNPNDEKAAAERMYRFLKQIHDRVQRPLWVTEWNNGAGWTKDPDPNPKQQADAVAAMIEMMEETPFVERYALFNWVEGCRELVRKDGTLTPAGEVYRDRKSTFSYRQPKK